VFEGDGSRRGAKNPLRAALGLIEVKQARGAICGRAQIASSTVRRFFPSCGGQGKNVAIVRIRARRAQPATRHTASNTYEYRIRRRLSTRLSYEL
jgi:hypothetical protein